MSNKIFVGKVRSKEFQSQSGPWTKTTISFNQNDLQTLQQHMNDQGYVNLLFNRSQKGNEYIEIDQWKPQAQGQPQYSAPAPVAQPQPVQQVVNTPMPDLNGPVEGSDIPF